ncbi:succinate dehydrogenase [Peptococcaceae bacterium 1198_IL3148]
MQRQRTLTKNTKTALYYDLLQLITGLILVGFLGMHLVFESTIMLGITVFNNLAHMLDQNSLPFLGIPLVIIAFFTHFLVAGRRIPTRFQEQRIIWRHAKNLNHPNTWAWVFQLISGMMLLVLVSIHIWVVITNWPIEATSSAQRASSHWGFYILLLLVAALHAGIGVYRQFVKWGWFSRRPVGIMISIVTMMILVIGLATIFAFMRLGGM